MSNWKNVQYKDGKLRTNEGGGGSSGHTYSTTEQQTDDIWVDGKPVYEITFNFQALNNSSDATKDISGLNVDTIISCVGMAYGGFEAVINFGDPYDIPSSIITCFAIKSSGLLCLRTRRSDASSFSAYVTMRYTKSTD